MEEEKKLKFSQNLEYDLQIPLFCFHVENIKQTFFHKRSPRLSKGHAIGLRRVHANYTCIYRATLKDDVWAATNHIPSLCF